MNSQHANEVAQQDVWDQDDFIALYREIGRETRQNTFETEAAKHMAEKVRSELRTVRNSDGDVTMSALPPNRVYNLEPR